MRWLSFIIFFSVFNGIFAGMHAYVWLRLVDDVPWPAPWSQLATGAITLCGVSFPVLMFAGRRLPKKYGNPITRTAYAWFGLLSLLVILTLFTEPLRLALPRLGYPASSFAQPLALSIGAGVLFLLAFGVYRALATPRIKRVQLALEHFPPALNGFRLVQLTDVHIGATLTGRWLERVVRRVNDANPDLVAITGDLVDGSVTRLKKEVEPLSRLRSTHGTHFVTGNHEYYSGADAWLDALREFGVRTLRNERVAIGTEEGSFELVGVDDYTAFGPGHGRDLAAAMKGVEDERCTVLLAHQPKQVHEAADRGVTLQLSGHTHGGQIFPFHAFVLLQQPFVAGLHKVRDTLLYISRGTGFWGPPLRVGAPPEITLLELSAPRPMDTSQ